MQHAGDNKHGRSIRLELSHAFCVCCEGYVGFYSVPQHIVGSDHIKKLNFRQTTQQRQQTIASTRDIMKRRGLVGQTVADDVVRYKRSLVLSACYSNITSHSLVTFFLIFKNLISQVFILEIPGTHLILCS